MKKLFIGLFVTLAATLGLAVTQTGGGNNVHAQAYADALVEVLGKMDPLENPLHPLNHLPPSGFPFNFANFCPNGGVLNLACADACIAQWQQDMWKAYEYAQAVCDATESTIANRISEIGADLTACLTVAGYPPSGDITQTPSTPATDACFKQATSDLESAGRYLDNFYEGLNNFLTLSYQMADQACYECMLDCCEY